MDDILSVLPFIVFLLLVWVTYLNISFGVTIYRSKKKDSTLELCLTNGGKYFYIALIIVYIIAFIGAMFVVIKGVVTGNLNDTVYIILNLITIVSLVVFYLLQQVIYVGSKQMLIGKIMFDYRKTKRVTYKKNKLNFTYGQKEYSTSIRFIDHTHLKKALQKAR